jgi:transposase
MLHRSRQLLVCQRTMLSNAIRGHMAELGIIAAKGRNGTAELLKNIACGSCSIKSKCTPNMTFRKIPRDVHEDARDHARALMGTPEFDKSRDERKKAEMRFAHLKTHHRFERMRLRGLSGARDEFHLCAIAQNLKTLANCLWRPPPNEHPYVV